MRGFWLRRSCQLFVGSRGTPLAAPQFGQFSGKFPGVFLFGRRFQNVSSLADVSSLRLLSIRLFSAFGFVLFFRFDLSDGRFWTSPDDNDSLGCTSGKYGQRAECSTTGCDNSRQRCRCGADEAQKCTQALNHSN